MTGGAGDDQQAEAEEEEAKHVVDPVAPQTIQDEEELDEDGAEGQQADGEHAGEGPEVAGRGGGSWRGIWFVRTGGSAMPCRKPIQEPAMLRGAEMRNQMPAMTSMVVKGTAPEEPRAQTKRLRRKKVLNTMMGMAEGV